jgi:hypothetical protein
MLGNEILAQRICSRYGTIESRVDGSLLFKVLI